MIDDGYFIQREVARAFRNLGWRVIPVKVEPQDGYVERLLTAIISYKPDLLFTVNHIGFDSGGAVASIITQIELPTISWFVDSPAYILLGAPGAVSPMIITPVWERSELPLLKSFGFDQPFHLPLAVDPDVMRVGIDSAIDTNVGFVGDSMTAASAKWLNRLPTNDTNDLMIDFCVKALLKDRQNSPFHPDIPVSWTELDRLNFASSVVLEATRRYRHSTLALLADDNLSVWGDAGWEGSLPSNVKLFPVVDYYRELPAVYHQTAINLNFTSLQMPTAVNQRVFDAPAAGGFLLTDDQDDLHQLFQNDEIATFSTPAELPERVRYFRSRPSEREAICSRASSRILSEHTYLHRVRHLLAEAKRRFA